MANNDETTKISARKNLSNAKISAQNQTYLRSREVIVSHFAKSADLITIQLTDTILYSASDRNQGAERFQALMRPLLSSSSDDKRPVLIWVARDLNQLRHVVRTIKSEDRALFDQLASCAIYAEAKLSAFLYRDLEQRPKKTATGCQYQTLTLHPNDYATQSADCYAIYGHCSPEKRGVGWDDGPICEPTSGSSNILIQPADDLHLAHQLLVGNIINVQAERAVKNLEISGIYPERLERLIS